jgi:molecular chaperone GrpE
MSDDNNLNPDGLEPAEAQPETPAEEVSSEDALREELEAANAKVAEYLEGWQRSRADFANYKRRVEKEKSEAYQSATGRVIGRFLDVMDDFDRAMQEKPADLSDAEALARWTAGIELIQRKLHNLLDLEGVTRIEAEGQAFDPQLHEAVTHEDSDTHEPGHVIGVVRQGYRIGDKVIRPAMVRVAR